MKQLTPAQIRFLRALESAPGSRLPGGELAVRAGYKGRDHSPYGGRCRAPMWSGRIFALMPPGLVREVCEPKMPKYYELTRAGQRRLAEAST